MTVASIEDLADEMLKCKLFGHAWDDFVSMLRPAKFGARVSVRCVRCTTERHDIVSWIDGGLLSREYRYPEGYHLSERHHRNEFRLAYVQRQKPRRRRRRSA